MLRLLNPNHLTINYPTAIFSTPQETENTITQDNHLIKKALVMIVGEHTDNQKRVHFFDEDALKKLIDNSNENIKKGKQIPVLLDHNKTVIYANSPVNPANNQFVLSQIGWVDGNSGFWGQYINSLEDLPTGKYIDPEFFESNYLNKFAIYCNLEIIKNKDDIRQGLGKHVSPGINPTNYSIDEISLVYFPAIPVAALFSSLNGDSYDFNFLANLINKATDSQGAGVNPIANKENELSKNPKELYSQIKQQNEGFEKIKQKLFDYLEILLSSMKHITDRNPEKIYSPQNNASIAELVKQYSNDLMEFLKTGYRVNIEPTNSFIPGVREKETFKKDSSSTVLYSEDINFSEGDVNDSKESNTQSTKRVFKRDKSLLYKPKSDNK